MLLYVLVFFGTPFSLEKEISIAVRLPVTKGLISNTYIPSKWAKVRPGFAVKRDDYTVAWACTS